MDKNIKFKLVKLENHVIVQFDHINEIVTLKAEKRINRFSTKIGTLTWNFRIMNRRNVPTSIKFLRSKSQRNVTIILNPSESYTIKRNPYDDYYGRRRGDRGFIMALPTVKKNKDLVMLKFKNNQERDSFCKAFLITMKDHISPSIKNMK